jgi:hypothetical protein
MGTLDKSQSIINNLKRYYLNHQFFEMLFTIAYFITKIAICDTSLSSNYEPEGSSEWEINCEIFGTFPRFEVSISVSF